MAEVFEELPVFRAFARERPRPLPALGPALVRRRPGRRRRAAGGGPSRRDRGLGGREDARRPGDPARRPSRRRGVRCRLADPRELEVRARPPVGGHRCRRRRLPARRARRAGGARGRGGAPPAGLPRAGRGVRELLPLPALGGQGVLRPAHRRGASPASSPPRSAPSSRASCRGRARSRSAARCEDGQEVDLVPFVIEQRADLVLKPAHGYGGHSVLVGETGRRRGLGAAVTRGDRAAVGRAGARADPGEEFPGLRGRRASLRAPEGERQPVLRGGRRGGRRSPAPRAAR